jgi:signal transduction histidine kinase
LAVSDDGVGFDPAIEENQEGFGLTSMRERIGKLGGKLEILSAPDEGTQIIACISLAGSAELPQEE